MNKQTRTTRVAVHFTKAEVKTLKKKVKVAGFNSIARYMREVALGEVNQSGDAHTSDTGDSPR